MKTFNQDTKLPTSKFFQSEMKVTDSGFVICEFPPDVMRHLKVKADRSKPATVHFAVIGGVVQISGEEPSSEIPIFSEDEFEQIKG